LVLGGGGGKASVVDVGIGGESEICGTFDGFEADDGKLGGQV